MPRQVAPAALIAVICAVPAAAVADKEPVTPPAPMPSPTESPAPATPSPVPATTTGPDASTSAPASTMPALAPATPAAALVGTPDAGEPTASSGDLGVQAVSADLGVAAGSHLTPGGLRVQGHYLYQLSSVDWFDGTAAFTFGSGAPACSLDRMGAYTCDHGLVDGRGVEVTAGVRRMLASRGEFRPFARAGLGLGVVRFPDDEVTGFTLSLHGGAGVRAQVADGIAVVVQAEVVAGLGGFGHAIGLAGQLGGAVLAGAEFKLE